LFVVVYIGCSLIERKKEKKKEKKKRHEHSDGEDRPAIMSVIGTTGQI
jgi:hypothetical protein